MMSAARPAIRPQPTGPPVPPRAKAPAPRPVEVPPLRPEAAIPVARLAPVAVPTPVRILLAGNDPAIVSRIGRILGGEPGFEVVGPCRDCGHLAFSLGAFAPGVFALGARPSSFCGALSLLRSLRARGLRPRVVLVGDPVPEDRLLEAARFGIHGAVSAEAPGSLLKECLRRVAAGGLWLRGPDLDRELLWSLGQLETLLPR